MVNEQSIDHYPYDPFQPLSTRVPSGVTKRDPDTSGMLLFGQANRFFHLTDGALHANEDSAGDDAVADV